MSQLRSFAPWIAYPAASALFGWQAGAAMALAFCVVGLVLDGRSASVDPFRVAALGLFGGLTVLTGVDPTSSVHQFVPALIPATLAAAAAMSIVVGRPFTVVFAKRVAPREFWDTPLFVHINMVLTGVWAASFAVTAAILAITLAVAPHAVAILLGSQLLGFVVPMRITRWYPAKAHANYATA
jgi:hypothetical protein